jgi:hypothetical protein
MSLVLTLALVLLAQAAARGTSRFLIGYPSERGGVYPPRVGRVAVVAVAAFGLQGLIVMNATGHRRWPGEVASLLVLVAAGIALARWCRSSERLPALLAAGALILMSAAFTPRVEWNASMLARLLTRLPLEATVAWAGWHVAAVRGRPPG